MTISREISFFISNNEPLIWDCISKMRNRLNLEHDFLYDIIQDRLPSQVQKRWNKAKETSFPTTVIVSSIRNICEDVEDAILLERKSHQLIVKYIPTIIERVNYQVRTGIIKNYDADDVLQSIQERLLEKLNAGQLAVFRQNEGTLFSTFLMKVVSNLIKDATKSLYQTHKNKFHQAIGDSVVGHSNEGTNTLLLLIEKEKEHYVLQQFRFLLLTHSDRNRSKLEICLKVNSRLLLSIQDAALLCLDIHQSKNLIAVFGKAYVHFSLGKLWKEICPFINIYEGKASSPDNRRKWYVRVRNQLVVKLLMRSILKDREDLTDIPILQKVNSERIIGKLAEEWLSEIVLKHYKAKHQ